MNNEILINKINFKKFSKRLLKEMKSIDVNTVNLNEAQNVLSRVFTKKDYNDMTKSFVKTRNEEDQHILNPKKFLQEFILNINTNMAIIEINNGDFSLHSGLFCKKIKNSIEKQNFSKICTKILDKDISVRYLNFINNNLSETHRMFNVRNEINCSLKMDKNGDFLQISNEPDPFLKQNKDFEELYVRSVFDEKENTYKLFIAKSNNFDVNKL